MRDREKNLIDHNNFCHRQLIPCSSPVVKWMKLQNRTKHILKKLKHLRFRTGKYLILYIIIIHIYSYIFIVSRRRWSSEIRTWYWKIRSKWRIYSKKSSCLTVCIILFVLFCSIILCIKYINLSNLTVLKGSPLNYKERSKIWNCSELSLMMFVRDRTSNHMKEMMQKVIIRK